MAVPKFFEFFEAFLNGSFVINVTWTKNQSYKEAVITT